MRPLQAANMKENNYKKNKRHEYCTSYEYYLQNNSMECKKELNEKTHLDRKNLRSATKKLTII